LLSSIIGVFSNSFASGAAGSPSNFEGPKATFYGVRYQPTWASAPLRYSNHEMDGTNPPPSMTTFDTVIAFDSDSINNGMPNLVGEMSTIFLPEEGLSNLFPWIPSSWLGEDQNINPYKEYTWNISDYTYLMKHYKEKFYVTLNGEWNSAPSWLGGETEAPMPAVPGITTSNSYKNLEVWIEIDMTPMWYIEGQGKAYFALGSIRLDKNVFQAPLLDMKGNTADKRGDVSVSPVSAPSPLFIFDNPWGASGSGYEQKTVYEYNGRQLNAQYFKDKAYVKLNLNDFGVYSGYSLSIPPVWTRGDVVTFAFDVDVFVIGEWTVQDIQKDPAAYGQFQKVSAPADWLEWGYENLWWIIPVAIIVLIIFVAPWLLVVIISLFTGRR
jgi:hypothetical protein